MYFGEFFFKVCLNSEVINTGQDLWSFIAIWEDVSTKQNKTKIKTTATTKQAFPKRSEVLFLIAFPMPFN